MQGLAFIRHAPAHKVCCAEIARRGAAPLRAQRCCVKSPQPCRQSGGAPLLELPTRAACHARPPALQARARRASQLGSGRLRQHKRGSALLAAALPGNMTQAWDQVGKFVGPWPLWLSAGRYPSRYCWHRVCKTCGQEPLSSSCTIARNLLIEVAQTSPADPGWTILLQAPQSPSGHPASAPPRAAAALHQAEQCPAAEGRLSRLRRGTSTLTHVMRASCTASPPPAAAITAAPAARAAAAAACRA